MWLGQFCAEIWCLCGSDTLGLSGPVFLTYKWFGCQVVVWLVLFFYFPYSDSHMGLCHMWGIIGYGGQC